MLCSENKSGKIIMGNQPCHIEAPNIRKHKKVLPLSVTVEAWHMMQMRAINSSFS